MNWVTMIAGVLLVLAPFVFGYTGTPAALWTCLIMGVVIAFLGYLHAYKWAAVAGLVAFVAPWVLGFSGIGAALWTCLILGAAVTVLAGYRGFISTETRPGAQHA